MGKSKPGSRTPEAPPPDLAYAISYHKILTLAGMQKNIILNSAL
jgi:hypothetical protein